MGRAAIRGAVEKALLAEIEGRPGSIPGDVRGAAGQSADAIREASRIGWVPLPHGIALRDAAVDAMGHERYVDLIHRLTLDSLDFAAFKNLGAGLMRMFERSPYGLAKASGRAWSTFTRDAGRFEFESIGPNSAVARYVELPVGAIDSAGLLATHEGSYRAALELAGSLTGQVSRFEDGDVAVYELSW